VYGGRGVVAEPLDGCVVRDLHNATALARSSGVHPFIAQMIV
jgi:hypothetical protein